jgi:hypothetical protein
LNATFPNDEKGQHLNIMLNPNEEEITPTPCLFVAPFTIFDISGKQTNKQGARVHPTNK